MVAEHTNSICAVAILRGEERFVTEWVAYHRSIGIDRFVLYDNDPALPLRALFDSAVDYVEVCAWVDDLERFPGKTPQIKAYLHALERLRNSFCWVTFIDGDEFIVLRKHPSLGAFLAEREDAGSILLNWHVFGHDGHYEDPEGLVITSLLRRMALPSVRTKSISRTAAIVDITSAHRCRLSAGWQVVDANGRPFDETLYPGRTDVAHINHYQCRSFLHWMNRAARGDVSFDRDNVPREHRWRLDEALLLRRFVRTVARDKNELVDEFMVQFEPAVRFHMRAMGRDR